MMPLVILPGIFWNEIVDCIPPEKYKNKKQSGKRRK